MGIIYIVGPTYINRGVEVSLRAKVDNKGRIIIPRSIRDSLGIKSGDELILSVEEDKIVVQKSSDAFDILRTVFKNLEFDRSLRRKAEEEAIKEIKKELGE